GAAEAFAEAQRLSQKKADLQTAMFVIDLGHRKLEQQDLAGAIASFREAVRLAPEHADAHYRLGLALHSQGTAVEAHSHLEKARQLAPYLEPPEPET
ncbi:MAG: tetratricopeptide repeat protein, partial [Gemmatimonadales bacterium]